MAKLIILVLFGTIAFATKLPKAEISSLRDPILDIDGVESVLALPSKPQGRITGGKEAEPNQFPHQVGLFLKMAEDSYSFCGGSLISNQWVLTAAHCADGIEEAEVRLGAHRIREKDAEQQEVLIVDKSEIRVHEGWDRAKLRNDIALLKLPRQVTLSEKIKPIALPRQSVDPTSFELVPVVASGWGKDSDSATTISDTLMYVESETMEQKVCRYAYFFSPPDDTTSICMDTKGGKSTCNGDSGGPLVAFEADGTPVVVGATSFGLALGCEKGWPVVFTRITAYLSWINEQTGIPLR